MISVVAPLSHSSCPLHCSPRPLLACLSDSIRIACRRRVGMRMPRCTQGISGMVQWTWSVSPVGQCVFGVCVSDRDSIERKEAQSNVLDCYKEHVQREDLRNNMYILVSVLACFFFVFVFLQLQNILTWREMWEKFPLRGDNFSASFRLWSGFFFSQLPCWTLSTSKGASRWWGVVIVGKNVMRVEAVNRKHMTQNSHNI